MTTIVWPRSLSPAHFGLNPRARSSSGSSSLSGVTQTSASDAGLWVANCEEFPIVNRSRVLLWRSLTGLINGRINPILFPFCDMNRRPKPWGPITVPHSDDSTFDDESEYEQPGVVVEVAVAADLRATTISLDLISSEPLEAGQLFSLNEHLYSILQIIDDAGPTEVKIWPPLREDILAGTHVEFDRPVCKMRLATDEEMDLDLQLRKRALPSIRLIEDVSA